MQGGDDSLFERRPQKQHTSDPSFAPEGSVAHVRAAQRLKSLSIRKRDSGKEDTDDLGRRKREPVESDDDEDLGSAPSRHVEAAVVLKASIQPAKVIRRDRPPQKTTQEEEEEEDEFEARRRRARQVDSDEEELLDREEEASSDEDEGSSSDDSSDYDSSDEDQLLPPRLLVQPVFVKKDMRETVAERERLEKQLEEEQKMEEVRAEERKRESKKLAEQVVVKEFEETVKEAAKPEEDIDKDIDEQAEYEAWKQRELARIKREKENRTARVKEIEETQRRRNLSDAQIRAENPERFYKEKKEMKFLQKYYHKGAFYQDDPGTTVDIPLRLRDSSILMMNYLFSHSDSEAKLDRSDG